MSDYYGDIRLGETIDIKFTTRQISGAPTTLAGSPVVSAYPGNSTTQLTAGITLTVDFDAVTGYNNIRVVASGGNGYVTATNYDLAITTGTVNSVSVVGESVGAFSVENRSHLMPTVVGRTLDVTVGGEAGIDWSNIGAPTTTVGLSGTTIKAVTDAVALPSSATINITGNITGNLSGSVGSVTGSVGSVAGNVAGSVGSVVGNVGGNVVGSVGSVVGDIGGLSAGAATDVEDAVWDAPMANHLDPGSTGASLNGAGSAGDPWGTPLPGAYGAGTAGNIVGNRLDVAVSSRMATYTQPTGFLSATFPSLVASTTNITAGTITTVSGNVNGSVGSVTGSVGSVTGSVGSVTGSVGSVTSPVTVGTNNDKTGYVLSAGGSAPMTELGGDPGATPTLGQANMLIYMALRNRRATTASADVICNNTGSAILTAGLSDDTTTFAKTKYT